MARSRLFEGIRGVAFLLAALLGLTVSASGSIMYSIHESFDEPVDGVPENWDLVWRGSGNSVDRIADIRDWGGAEAGEPASGLGFFLRRGIAAENTHADHNANLVFTGEEGGDNEDGILADYSGSVVVTATLGGTSWAGVLLRSSQANIAYSSSDGYFIALRGGTGEAFGIYKDPVSHVNAGTLLASTTFSLSSSANYQLQFSVIGNVITAAAYGWNETDQNFTNLMGSALEYTDNDDPYTEGYFALRSGFGNTNVQGQFADLAIDVIPEPGSVMLLLLGAAGLAWTRRARRAA